MKMITINDLVGKTLKSIRIENDNTEIHFVCDDGTNYLMYHSQDCCENVYISDINGNLDNLIGTPILRFEEKTTKGGPNEYSNYCSATWTFYTIITNKGYVDIRWVGESSGDYSEKVDFDEDFTLLN